MNASAKLWHEGENGVRTRRKRKRKEPTMIGERNEVQERK